MVNSDLPQEILIDIFSRLPAKSVGRCRCLAKSWRTLLSSPHFIKLHLTRKPDQQNLILITQYHVLSIDTIKDDATSVKLDFLGNYRGVVAGSCDGLILLVNDEYELLLVNPINLQQVSIPDSPLALRKRDSFSMFGFGYDRSSDDYKIVALSNYDTDNEHEPDCAVTFVDVYSAKLGVWRRVENSPYDHSVPELSSGAFVNGAIHCLASSRASGHRSVIVAFSLADEVFDEIPAPSGVDMDKFVFNRLVVVGGCLCMINNPSNDRPNIWIMRQYGLRESWMRLSVDADYGWDIFKVLCYIGDEEEEVVLLTEEESLVVYNIKEGTLRNMMVDGAAAVVFEDGETFVPTLVSPTMLMEL